MSTTKRTRRTGSGARINMDSIVVYRMVAAIVVLSALAAVIASWDGLLYVSAWLMLPAYLSWILPVMIDLPISGLALGALSLKSLGRPFTAGLFTATAIVFVALAGAANFLYVVSARGLDDFTDWTGAIAKGLAPAITLVMTEALGALIAKQKVVRKKRAVVKRGRKPAPVAPAPIQLFEDEGVSA